MTNKTLLFLSYGGQPQQIAEATYGMLSAYRALRGAANIDLLLYTDSPDQFADLPIETRKVTAQELTEWAGPAGYHYRRKPAVVRDALLSLRQPVVFVDSDTWFRKPAAALFDRVAPGRSVLHLREGSLRSSNNPGSAGLADALAVARLTDTAGRPLSFAADPAMWNSGVIGLDPADVGLLDEAMHLIDQVWPQFQGSPQLEQFAVGHFLEAGTTVQEAADIVFHYWSRPIRQPFAEQLPGLLRDTGSLPPEQRAEVLFRHRPRPTGARLAKHLGRELYRRAARRDTRVVRSSAT